MSLSLPLQATPCHTFSSFLPQWQVILIVPRKIALLLPKFKILTPAHLSFSPSQTRVSKLRFKCLVTAELLCSMEGKKGLNNFSLARIPPQPHLLSLLLQLPPHVPLAFAEEWKDLFVASINHACGI